MQIFHIATAADWATAHRSGAYTTSTRGVTLEDEGFLHAARRDQVAGVFRRYYADSEEQLVLLTIDTDLLDVPWREDSVGSETFPHIYGPLSPGAVTQVQRLNRGGGTESLSELFVKEMGLRIGLAILAMLLAYAGSRVGAGTDTEWGSFVGAVVGLVVGAAIAILVLRRRPRAAHLTRRR